MNSIRYLSIALACSFAGAGCTNVAKGPNSLPTAAAKSGEHGSYAVAISKQNSQIIIRSINDVPFDGTASPELGVVLDFIRDAPELYELTRSPAAEKIALLKEGSATVVRAHVEAGQVHLD